jgi:DNA mismatch endonuclease, patch repair protein
MSRTPRYEGLTPRSGRASAAARGSSRKTDTVPELLLRRALWRQGLRYQTNRSDLPGRPDIVFPARSLVVFVDGDFWHGKNWLARKAKLAVGHNPDYWIRKIERNVERDKDCNRELRSAGWRVLRVWESQIHRDLSVVVHQINVALGRI